MQGLLVSYAPLCYLVDNQKYQFMKQNCMSISVYVDRRNGLSMAENTQSARQFVQTQSATSSMKAPWFVTLRISVIKIQCFPFIAGWSGDGHAVSPCRPDEGLGLTSPSGCQGLSGQPFRAGRGCGRCVVSGPAGRRVLCRHINPCPSRHGGLGQRHRLRRSAPH